MANVNPQVPLTTGLSITQSTLLTTSSFTVIASTAQGSLKTDRLVVYFQSSGSTLSSIEPLVGSTYSSIGQSNFTAIAIPTSEAVIAFGGKGFDLTRMQKTDGTIEFYNTGNTVLAWAIQQP